MAHKICVLRKDKKNFEALEMKPLVLQMAITCTLNIAVKITLHIIYT